jgi:branched-chain amino acid aminotransferase
MAVPDASMIREMIIDAVEANAAFTPNTPGSLYIRPTFVGTAPNIGAAAAPSDTAMLYVICSPVGDYFKGGVRPLRIYVETKVPRTTPQFGTVKSGANYVMALGPTLDAKRDHGADQVLFATGDDITETGASNFFLCDSDRVITRSLDDSFLHGITRDSVIKLAAGLGYAIEERRLGIGELRDWAQSGGEIFLSGTAAVVAPVGSVVVADARIAVGDGEPGPNTLRIRDALTALLAGEAEDPHGWRTVVQG